MRNDTTSARGSLSARGTTCLTTNAHGPVACPALR